MEILNTHIDSKKATKCTNAISQSSCDPFSNNKFSKKTKSVFTGIECGDSHSGSDFDTDHDTVYGKL